MKKKLKSFPHSKKAKKDRQKTNSKKKKQTKINSSNSSNHKYYIIMKVNNLKPKTKTILALALSILTISVTTTATPRDPTTSGLQTAFQPSELAQWGIKSIKPTKSIWKRSQKTERKHGWNFFRKKLKKHRPSQNRFHQGMGYGSTRSGGYGGYRSPGGGYNAGLGGFFSMHSGRAPHRSRRVRRRHYASSQWGLFRRQRQNPYKRKHRWQTIKFRRRGGLKKRKRRRKQRKRKPAGILTPNFNKKKARKILKTKKKKIPKAKKHPKIRKRSKKGPKIQKRQQHEEVIKTEEVIQGGKNPGKQTVKKTTTTSPSGTKTEVIETTNYTTEKSTPKINQNQILTPRKPKKRKKRKKKRIPKTNPAITFPKPKPSKRPKFHPKPPKKAPKARQGHHEAVIANPVPKNQPSQPAKKKAKDIQPKPKTEPKKQQEQPTEVVYDKEIVFDPSKMKKHKHHHRKRKFKPKTNPNYESVYYIDGKKYNAQELQDLLGDSLSDKEMQKLFGLAETSSHTVSQSKNPKKRLFRD